MPVVNQYVRWVPDLGRYTPANGEAYQPSNGTEGDCFREGWCDHCKRDKIFRERQEDGCDIIARTMAFSPKDAQYPIEWQWRDGEPVCTAFDDEALQITNEERVAQLPLL